MKKWNFLGLVLIAAVIQATLLDNFRFFGASPNLLLICVFISATSFDWTVSLFLCIFCGMVYDFLGAQPFGINTFLFPLFSLALANLTKKITLDEYFWISSAILFLLTFLYGIAIRIFYLSSGILIPFFTFLRIAFLGSVYNALILAVILRFFKPLLVKII